MSHNKKPPECNSTGSLPLSHIHHLHPRGLVDKPDCISNGATIQENPLQRSEEIPQEKQNATTGYIDEKTWQECSNVVPGYSQMDSSQMFSGIVNDYTYMPACNEDIIACSEFPVLLTQPMSLLQGSTCVKMADKEETSSCHLSSKFIDAIYELPPEKVANNYSVLRDVIGSVKNEQEAAGLSKYYLNESKVLTHEFELPTDLNCHITKESCNLAVSSTNMPPIEKTTQHHVDVVPSLTSQSLEVLQFQSPPLYMDVSAVMSSLTQKETEVDSELVLNPTKLVPLLAQSRYTKWPLQHQSVQDDDLVQHQHERAGNLLQQQSGQADNPLQSQNGHVGNLFQRQPGHENNLLRHLGRADGMLQRQSGQADALLQRQPGQEDDFLQFQSRQTDDLLQRQSGQANDLLQRQHVHADMLQGQPGHTNNVSLGPVSGCLGGDEYRSVYYSTSAFLPYEGHRDQHHSPPPPPYSECVQNTAIQKCQISRKPLKSGVRLSRPSPNIDVNILPYRDNAEIFKTCSQFKPIRFDYSNLPSDRVNILEKNMASITSSRSDIKARQDEGAPETLESDHQLLAFISCLFCWPIGLVAIYYSNMCQMLKAEGNYIQAQLYARQAFIISTLGLCSGSLTYIIFFIYQRVV